jgi:hypothetical protein
VPLNFSTAALEFSDRLDAIIKEFEDEEAGVKAKAGEKGETESGSAAKLPAG